MKLILNSEYYKKIQWHNITYPAIFGWLPNWLYWLWKNIFCQAGFHLFDEVSSSSFGHYLYCDACELHIQIDDNKYDE